MAKFIVDKDMPVYVRSSRDAAYPQHFQIKRELNSRPGYWEVMGKEFYDSGVDGGNFVSFSEITTWEIRCFNYNGGWRESRESSPIEGVGTPFLIVRYDDDGGGDNDYNDTVVKVAIGQPFPPGSLTGTVTSEKKEYPTYDGDGNYRPKPETQLPHWYPRRKGDIEP